MYSHIKFEHISKISLCMMKTLKEYEDNDIVLIFVGMNRKHSKQSLQLLMENSMQIMYAITIKSKADADKLRVKYEVR